MIVCGVLSIVTVRTTGVADANVALPAWLAVTVHVPAPEAVSVGAFGVPVTEHGPDAAKLTGSELVEDRDQTHRARCRT